MRLNWKSQEMNNEERYQVYYFFEGTGTETGSGAVMVRIMM